MSTPTPHKASSYQLSGNGKGSWPARNLGPKFRDNYDSIFRKKETTKVASQRKVRK